MPQRKRRPTAADSSNAAESANRPKRQRVSLACDSCRTAREKCDGARPDCGTCRSQNRSCSYTPTSRKRGVKTGYLRTVELSLAWLFDQVPEAEKKLHRVLSESNGSVAEQVFVAKGKTCERLHRKWMKSRVHADIEKIISEERPTRNDTPQNNSEDEESAGQESRDSAEDEASSPNSGPSGVATGSWTQQSITATTPSHRLSTYPKLPTHWRRYVDIYFTYTHCWMPIVHREDVFKTALSYPPDGFEHLKSSDPYTIACHAQLWAILSLGAYQDADCNSPSGDTVSPHDMYETAKMLIPGDDSNFERPIMCTLLIHGLILMGKSKNVAAWLIIGRAMRLLLSTERHMNATSSISSRYLANNPVLAACHLLDTLLSTCLQRPTHLTTELESYGQSIMSVVAPEALEAWNPLPGFGSSIQRQSVSGYPFLTLYQLLEFSATTGVKVQSDKHPHMSGRRITTDDLVRSLHPQLQFCSSLNVGSFVPNMPSAVLLQIAFLSSTMLISGYRASLLSTLLEIIDQSIEHFGSCGTPPVVACLMESVEKKINFEDMRPSERTKWSWLREKLLYTWQAGKVPEADNSYGHGGQHGQQIYSSATESFTPQLAMPAYRPSPRAGVVDERSQDNRLSADSQASYLEAYLTPDYARHPAKTGLSPALPTPSIATQGSPDVSRQSIQQFPTAGGNQPMDYDAIFDELGAIDYGDTMEMDPQFMANLGFAPGCNITDMFHADFGG
ncbi:hypothetical protein K4F52_001534 [Lecanicillium sp. MT-2017a]|nr:hypothetical protein K4F52_001534 [Lecanicillium sp. MT-2017a]